MSNSYFQEGTEALKLKLMKRCQAEEQVERQLESVFRHVSRSEGVKVYLVVYLSYIICLQVHVTC